MQSGSTHDTIAAIATADGAAGVAIVRISGPESWVIAERVVRCSGPCLTSRAAGQFFVAGFADFVSGEMVDRGLVLLFRAPASFTGEDVVELQGHGGSMASRAVLRAVLSAGARLAEPGEFTRRAFLHGRLDLTQAEAIMDLVHARSERAARAARAQLAGSLGREIEGCYADVTALCADVEAQLDFEADELPVRVRRSSGAQLERIRARLAHLLATRREGQLLRDGALVVIGGCPNSGKSSLLNALLASNRAIVSSEAGTTRDTIEEGVVLCGIPVRLMDTAGLRDTDAVIEQEGVVRAHRALQEADLVIYLIDSSRPLTLQHPHLFSRAMAQSRAIILPVLNKCDLPGRTSPDEVCAELTRDGIQMEIPAVMISVTTGTGLAELKSALMQQLGVERQAPIHATVTERHGAELLLTDQALCRACTWLTDDDSKLVLAAGELRQAAEALGRIIGRTYTPDLLEQIFARFCVGK